MKNLSIDSSIVPVIYRVEVTAGIEEVGSSTVQCLQSEIAGKALAVQEALEGAGYEDVHVAYYPA